ncbi:glycoside hydrolase family 65 protein [Aerococcaceae bacterium zg-BR9]|uniref:glycoside hydrolase family 65 protein n=1 Tax=Aerococcaceae bacterium zg-1292 TaxID=2774330 RepID=UPI004063A754|nr:glycoside hydrolase family 65 protein [Aerococcaceae bacterium zg-BR9]
MVNLDYLTGNKWGIVETSFDSKWLRKFETIMAQGNGYMGVRASLEEAYTNEKRGHFVAGVFNQFDNNEVTELTNVADLVHMEIKINGELLNLSIGKVTNYQRTLNIKTGELHRVFNWELNNIKLAFSFKRIVSLKRLHILAQEVNITNLGDDCTIEIVSGIDGQITNSGSQHFSEGEKHLYDGKYLQMSPVTTNSKVKLVHSTVHQFKLNEKCFSPSSRIEMERRKIHNRYFLKLKNQDFLNIEKISSVHSSRDKNQDDLDIETRSINDLKAAHELGYNQLLEESISEWKEKVWDIAPIKIYSTDPLDQLGIYFAKYHLHIMTPGHDNRMNIGAKGLSGEGYKGHTFWDTEIFMLPYFIFTHPTIAKSLVEYRYFGLEGAHRKAQENGFLGAQYPWESAWIDDGETTPIWGAADIITGKATKIWSGFIEQHITGDVAYGIKQYFDVTHDEEFMDTYGYEVILDTAKFWASRLEYNENLDRFEINNVIGPDEYKEHINNNAYTNYIAYWNMDLAIKIMDLLYSKQDEVFSRLNNKFNFEKLTIELEKRNKLYLPKPNGELLIPQDDTYLSKKVIDLSSYKDGDQVGSLFHDYNLTQVNDMQITKQADVMLLVYLFENLFNKEIKIANWNYYEPKTTHDSSLSLSTHAALAADLNELELSYDLFKKARDIDMGKKMKSSDEGVHAASLGGIWQIIVFGYGGVRVLDGKLRIEPHLPNNWSKLEFGFFWHGQLISVVVSKENFEVILEDGSEAISIVNKGTNYIVEKNIKIKL